MAPTTKLPIRPLGRGGPEVVALGAGLMSMGGAYGYGGSDEERFTYLDRAYELGETNWDTANVYGDVEDVVGKWFKRTGKRNEIFLATKFGFMNPMEPANVRTDPENVFESCESSLKRLQTEWIDLFYCHRVDGKTPIEKTVQAMVELKK
jgi:aryl-alcohol dehydrogenase-like predicted oxidoreductase